MYRGYVATTLKQASATSVRLGTYNILKDAEKKYDISVQSTATTFANGAVAGTTTTFTTQPVDCIKTRAQSAKGATLRDAVESIWKEEGLKGFWRGTTMRLGRTVLSGGILFTAYEQVAAILRPMFGER